MTGTIFSLTINFMSIDQLLHSMCTELPDTDLNAIRKARGFSLNETASRTSFASFYVSSIGVESALQTLTPEEIITLQLVHEIGEVDISFFDRTYPSGNSFGTFTQQYKNTFDSVKKNLVRRGLLIVAESQTRGDHPQMERWRFALPVEFTPYLPALSSKTSELPGETSEYALRKKLLELIGGSAYIEKDIFPILVKNGTIFLNDLSLSLASLQTWQNTTWRSVLKSFSPRTKTSFEPTQAVLKLLNTQTWISAQTLEPALKIYCFGGQILSVEKILHEGWQMGLLVRQKIDSVQHYRLPQPASNPAVPDHSETHSIPGLDQTSRPGCLKIDLRLIPLQDLEILNATTHFELIDGVLHAFPSLLKLGRAQPQQRNSWLAHYLAENIPAFKETLETANNLWGKTLLHENLLVARVRDLSLRIQLERELKDKIIILNEHFIAFPNEARPLVEKILKKTGFVTKTIHP